MRIDIEDLTTGESLMSAQEIQNAVAMTLLQIVNEQKARAQKSKHQPKSR